MVRRGILFFVLIALVSSISQRQYIDRIICQCRLQAEKFAATEEKYVITTKPGRDEIDTSGGNIADLQNIKLKIKAYEKEKRQRPFECIANSLDPFSLMLVEYNAKYKALVKQCKSEPQPLCNASELQYRTFDGTCNNLLDKKRGSIFSCLRRYGRARYEGVSGIRGSVCGKPLPASRDLSLFLTKDQSTLSRISTHMTTFFGQFVAHDITDVPKISVREKDINCDPEKVGNLHPECKIVFLRKNDPFYSQFHKTNFPGTRSAICDSCTSLKKRIQMNLATAYLDLSMIYGLLKSTNDGIRRLDGSGKLKSQKNKCGQDILPPSFDEVNRCGYAFKGEYCFASGDRRVNQNLPLTSLHTLFQLEHNRIADKLKRINPLWDDERTFQEARKINIAQFQIIVYKEYLSVLLGSRIMDKNDLRISDGYTLYNDKVDAGLWVEFNTAAFRLHNTVHSTVTNFGIQEDIRLFRNESFQIAPLYHCELGSFLEGICSSPAQQYSMFVSDDLKHFLYKRPSSPYGFDLFTVNIDRGRDNGLSTYSEMVKNFLGLNINSFQDLKVLMNKESIKKLSRAYCDVKDIDLIVGLWNEMLRGDSLVGPTAAEIIGLQFRDIKFGDRFYVEHSGNFKLEQLQSLKGVTLSSVLCSNTDMEYIQRNAFRFPSKKNRILNCDSFPKTNINLWKE